VTATRLLKFVVGDLKTKLILDTEIDICSSHRSQLILMGVLKQLSIWMGRNYSLGVGRGKGVLYQSTGGIITQTQICVPYVWGLQFLVTMIIGDIG
jgi:hypothetical protein